MQPVHTAVRRENSSTWSAQFQHTRASVPAAPPQALAPRNSHFAPWLPLFNQSTSQWLHFECSSARVAVNCAGLGPGCRVCPAAVSCAGLVVGLARLLGAKGGSAVHLIRQLALGALQGGGGRGEACHRQPPPTTASHRQPPPANSKQQPPLPHPGGLCFN